MTLSNSGSSFDGELVQMLCSNDPVDRQRAWAKLYRQCYPQVRSLVLNKGGKVEDVGDLFHDALIALLKNLQEKKFEFRASVSTYLYGICYKLFCKKFQKAVRKQDVELAFWESLSLDSDYDPTRDILWDRVASALMGKLKPECREILVEFYFNKRSMRELQSHFNVNSEQAVKNKKMRCLNYLRALIENTDINPEIQEE
jgi:RNA polymerase sigma factor (sigma-70 family)